MIIHQMLRIPGMINDIFGYFIHMEKIEFRNINNKAKHTRKPSTRQTTGVRRKKILKLLD